MRILFAHNNGDLYGSSRSLLRLTSRLVRDGHVVRTVLPCPGQLRTALEAAHVEVTIDEGLSVIDRHAFRSPIRLVRFLLGLSPSVARFRGQIRDFSPDVIHTNTSVIPTPGVAARREGVRHVWHVRECYSEFPLLWPMYCRHIARYSDRILCVSEAVALQFPSLAGSAPVRVLNNGFPEEEFAPVTAERVKAFRDAFGLGNSRLVGVVGRIKLGRKGQETFISAAARLHVDYPEVRFVVIGSPYHGNENHLDALKQQARQIGLGRAVVFTGDVEDVKAAYAALEVVVLPSGLPEPFSGAVIEAMAMGKPVVGTRIGGTVEQIDDEVTGFLVSPHDPAGMATALLRLIGAPELGKHMGAAGLQRYRAQFTFDPFYRGILSVYGSTQSEQPAETAATDARPRVLLVHTFYQNFGGEDSIALREKKLLEAHGYDVHFYCRHNTETKKFSALQKLVFVTRTISSGRTRREVQRIIERFKPDIAYVHNVFPLVSPSVYRVLRKNGIPVFQNIQDFRWLCPNGLFYNRFGVCERCKKGAYWNAVRFRCFRDSYALSALYATSIALNRALGTLNRIDAILCVTPYSRQKFADAGVPESHLFIKPNFVHAPPALPRTGTEDYAAFLGRLSTEKGLWTLIRAFESMPDLRLHIVGTGPIEADLRQYVKEHGLDHIVFEGFAEGTAKARLLQNAAFMVFTSEWYEHFPIVLLEAFAAGLPVIASRIGNMPYIVRKGETGLWFEAGNVEDLRDAVRTLIGDRDAIRRMGETARRLVDTVYSAEANATILHDLFSAAMRKKCTRALGASEVQPARDERSRQDT